MTVMLHDGWTVAPVGELPPEVPAASWPVPATVPGCVHTDLLAAGLIPDPYLDANETLLGWIGRTDWRYELSFDWAGPDADRTDLVCAGLDTVATVAVNGIEVGRTANMHRSYRFEVGSLLSPGRNTLTVHFGSAYRYAEEVRDRLGDRPNSYPEPFNLIRKMACNFGWDWGPTLVTAGIWQPIGLHGWSVTRLASVRPVIADNTVDVHIGLERIGYAPVTVIASVAGRQESVVVDGSDASVRLEVPDVERWWPRGYGDQPRYDLSVTLLDVDGTELDRWERRIGFRSVRVDTEPDADGTPFTLLVNEEPVSVRGFNWIPDDCFPHRVDRARYATRLAQAVDAGANFIRVWGGGRYESEDFHDLADELGLLVSQDFPFACAAYPEEEPLASEVAEEAREQVVRLAHHPSLVLWIGNNENLWGHADWGWRTELGERTWGAGYYFDVLPAIVAELDPTRPYWPGSPYSGRRDLHPNDPAHGTTHIWTVWNTHDYTHYVDYRPRFVAEFGFQGPASYATIRRMITTGELDPDSDLMLHHQKAGDGNAKLLRGLEGHLPEPATFDDWHWATQLNQARAMAFGVEHLRSLHPLCAGVIVWQLNDCWPVTSWSAVDGDGRRKPLWYALRRAFAERLIVVRDGNLVAVNDTAKPWQVEARCARIDFRAVVLAETDLELAVPARGAASLPLPDSLVQPADPAAELIEIQAGDMRRLHFFAEDVDLRLPAPAYEVTVNRRSDGHEVTIRAGTLLRDLALFPDRLDPSATVDDQLITLLPGESVTFTVSGAPALDTSMLTRPVLRCANDLARV